MSDSQAPSSHSPAGATAMTARTVEQLLSEHDGDLSGMRVLIRSDLNVPIEAGEITDDGRIRASVPTIKQLGSAGARVLVVAHLGRPDGTADAKYSLAPVAARLGELVQKPVQFAGDTVGPEAQLASSDLGSGDVAVLENVRFNSAETSKDDTARGRFADELAQLADVFVSDGFGVLHRKQASVYDIALKLPSYAGGLVQSELEVLNRLTGAPSRPYVVVLGGSKVSDKIGVIDHLMDKVDSLLIGGAMVYTFLKAQGYDVGKSLVEEDQVDQARSYIDRAAQQGVTLVLPTDVVVAPEFAADAPATTVPVEAIPSDQIGLDIGPESSARFAQSIEAAQTAFWNGPMGVFEFPAFATGTRAVAQALSQCRGLSVVGGGDSAAAVRQLGFADSDFGHISTGGGASLEYLEGKDLPGLTVLEQSR